MKIRFSVVSVLALMLFSCAGDDSGKAGNVPQSPSSVSFSETGLAVRDGGVPKSRGQVLYMPVYSNIPLGSESRHDLSAFIAVHNTDLENSILVTKVVLFDTDGKAVKDYLPEPKALAPLATGLYIVPKQDQSGPGANFIVEWTSVPLVTAPLVESVIKDLSGNMGLSFLSTGKVIRERK